MLNFWVGFSFFRPFLFSLIAWWQHGVLYWFQWHWYFCLVRWGIRLSLWLLFLRAIWCKDCWELVNMSCRMLLVCCECKNHNLASTRWVPGKTHWGLVDFFFSHKRSSSTWLFLLLVRACTNYCYLHKQIIPQSVCSRHGLAIGATVAPVVHILVWICYPVAYPISKVKLFG